MIRFEIVVSSVEELREKLKNICKEFGVGVAIPVVTDSLVPPLVQSKAPQDFATETKYQHKPIVDDFQNIAPIAEAALAPKNGEKRGRGRPKKTLEEHTTPEATEEKSEISIEELKKSPAGNTEVSVEALKKDLPPTEKSQVNAALKKIIDTEGLGMEAAKQILIDHGGVNETGTPAVKSLAQVKYFDVVQACEKLLLKKK